MSTRTLQQIIESVPATEGAGVRIRRSLGRNDRLRVDPFLMLDEFSSENPDDYVAGFPAHPHRGFETVTYMLDGHMRHQDHLGHTGDLKGGGVQWMTAGRGIIHSEMPQQDRGRMRGFQLWLNLPAKEKMKPASYRDIQPTEIPVAELPAGGQVKVIAGTLTVGEESTPGPIQGLSTEPIYFDVQLPARSEFAQAIKSGHSAFVYPYEGSIAIGPASARRSLTTHNAGVLSAGEKIEIASEGGPARFILVAGKPLGEPIVQYGPFVMNTREEIEQALRDYQSGRLTESA
jgi:redox-sensitive bicupin YhaK (pirin superfamily)